jgi:hypothetical protein
VRIRIVDGWPVSDPLQGRIYFVFSPSQKAIKIGFSTDVAQRIADLNTALSEPLILLGTLPGVMDDEKQLHRLFASWRLSGEWFTDDGVIRDFVVASLDRMDVTVEAVLTWLTERGLEEFRLYLGSGDLWYVSARCVDVGTLTGAGSTLQTALASLLPMVASLFPMVERPS